MLSALDGQSRALGFHLIILGIEKLIPKRVAVDDMD
jgi:hypothetical protein